MDRYKQELIKLILDIKGCQDTNDLQSCYDCSQVVNCKQRQDYVDAVYKSMNKGTNGGFEF